MNTKRYMISDASKKVDVESHVLRYWEEELELNIPRNELGHRYYTEENIKLLKNIKVLKEQGFQLKAIKMVVPELEASKDTNLDYMLTLRDELNKQAEMEEEIQIKDISALSVHSEVGSVDKPVTIFKSEDKMQQFQIIMSNIISKALQDNNVLLGKQVSERVSDSVLKEMDYLMRIREEKEDERFKRLDESIRAHQKSRQAQKESKKETKKVKAVKKAKKKGVFRKARATV